MYWLFSAQRDASNLPQDDKDTDKDKEFAEDFAELKDADTRMRGISLSKLDVRQSP